MVIHKGIDIYCFRCNVKVYHVDKIGPLKGAFFHHQCFKCRICGLVLNMKNFIQNQLEPEDKEVYCNTHVPKSLAGHLSGDAMGIRSALSAPKKAGFCNEQIRGSDKYNPDTHAIEIQNALMNLKTNKPIQQVYKPKKWENKKPFYEKYEDNSFDFNHKAKQILNDYEEYNSIDGNSPKYNMTDIAQQNDIQTINNYLQHHKCMINGSPNIDSPSPSDDTVDYECQIGLEKRLRAEEDEMYATFAKLRLDEEKKLENRFKDEFLQALTQLRDKFAKVHHYSSSTVNRDDSSSLSSSSPMSRLLPNELDAVNSSSNQAPQHYHKRNAPAPSLVAKEERELERRLTVRRDREKDALSRKLIEYERAEAAKLMEKHADEMLKFTTLKRRTNGKKRGALLCYGNGNDSATAVVALNSSDDASSHHSQAIATTTTIFNDNGYLLPQTRRDVTEGQKEALFLNNKIHGKSPEKSDKQQQQQCNSQHPLYSRVVPTASNYSSSNSIPLDERNRGLSRTLNTDPNHKLPQTREGKSQTPDGGTTHSNIGTRNSTSSYNSIITEPPAPGPPKCLKRQIYKDPSIFEEIDQRAINVASTIQNSFTDLVRQLTRHCNTDVQKARALFRWITIKNLNRMTFDNNVGLDTPMGLLRGIKLGTESYHMLFKRLCSYTGLHCVVIRGYSKSAGYLPGMRFEDNITTSPYGSTAIYPNTYDEHDDQQSHIKSESGLNNYKKFRNTWNAAYLDGSWRFVQCNWGARHLVNNSSSQTQNGANSVNEIAETNNENGSSSSPSNENLRYEYDDHYFLTDPGQFIYEFYPKQPQWQLLPTPITLQQFENLPFIRSLFFKYDLTFVDFTSTGDVTSPSSVSSKRHQILPALVAGITPAILQADTTGAANLTLRMPLNYVPSLVFHYNLRFYNNSNGSIDTIDGINMRRYVMQTLVGNNVVFKIHCPSRGEFLLDVFANQVRAADYASGRAMRFKSVCKAKIECRTLEKIMIPLPDCASGEWGPVKAYKLFSMIPVTHEDAVINTQSHFLVIKFKFAPNFSPMNRPYALPASDSPPSGEKYIRYDDNGGEQHTNNPRKKLVDFAAALHKNDFEPPDLSLQPYKKSPSPEEDKRQNVLSKCVLPKWCFKVTGSRNSNGSSSGSSNRPNESDTWSDNVEGIKFEITLPEEGQFGLDIYAREELIDRSSSSLSTTAVAKEKQLLTHACKYLINYRLS